MTTFNNNVRVVQNSLVTVCSTFNDPLSGTITASRTSPSSGIGTDTPYIWVRRGRQLNREELSSDLYRDTYQYQVLCYVVSLADGESDDESEFDTASDWIKPFHKHLAQNRQLAEGALIIVNDVRDTSDVNLFDKQAVRFAGVAFTVPITFYTRF